MGIVGTMNRKWCGREAVIALFLRQLKFPSSNINKLDKPVAVSTGTFVIHSVIHQCDSCWLKSHPSTHRNLTTSKKGLKGQLLLPVILRPAKDYYYSQDMILFVVF